MDTAVDDSIRNSIYTGLKKTAGERRVWQTLRRDCHKLQQITVRRHNYLVCWFNVNLNLQKFT